MRQKLPLCVAAVGVVALFLAASGQAAVPEYVPDRLLVKFCPGTPASEVARAHAAAGSAILDEIPQIGVQIVGLPPGLGVLRAADHYLRNPNVEFAEPDYYVEPAAIPNDPCFPYGQGPLQWMEGPQAWDITTGSPEVLVAVLDSGADFTHPDLQGRLVAGWDFVDSDGNPTDTHGHGTAVTGVLGATANNNFGLAGVSWHNPVLEVRIVDGSGYTTTGLIAQGITYAADQGARAINLSTAGTSYSSTEANAVDYAWSKGAVIIAAAGNSSSSTPYYPAALPRVVAVCAVDGNNVLWYGSNYGAWVDLAAPYVSVTTNLGGTVSCAGGTSIATPFVTGLFGLVFSVNPSLTPQQAVDLVEQTADDLGDTGFDSYYGWGKINLYRAVVAAQSAVPGDSCAPAAAVTSPSAGTILSGSITVSATAGDNVGVTRAECYVDTTLIGSVSASPYTWAWNTTLFAAGSHTLLVKAYDAAGNVGASTPVTVTVDNSPPTAAVTAPTAGASVSGTASVTAAASDATTGVREVRFYLDGLYQASSATAPFGWAWDSTRSASGSHSLQARAYDLAGNAGDSSTVSVNVQNAPTGAIAETFTGLVGYAKSTTSRAHMISVAGPGAVSAALTWSARANLDLYLYSPTGALIAAAATGGRTTSEQINCQVSATGICTLKVVAASGKADYTLTVTHP